MGYLVLPAQKDPQDCLAFQAFPEREENLDPREPLAEKENLERKVGLGPQETPE